MKHEPMVSVHDVREPGEFYYETLNNEETVSDATTIFQNTLYFSVIFLPLLLASY